MCESVEGDRVCVRVWRGMGCVCEVGDGTSVCVSAGGGGDVCEVQS